MTYQPDNERYFALALDPIHVGTGGYRLGRVDMSIVREPGTNVPKIPGTSLSGACRTYAAMTADTSERSSSLPPIWPHCAGQGQPDEKRNYKGHCGDVNCPICVTFGFSKGTHGGSFQGLAQFSDAQLVLFPVYSLAGPVWITCSAILHDLDIMETDPQDAQVRVADGVKISERLNLGWLMLNAKTGFSLSLPAVPPEILNRAVLVSNKLFGQIVNDNLEVRTSVSIDPNTGAAADGALFTYEALPRASVLAFDVVMSAPKYYCINGQVPLSNRSCSDEQETQPEQNDITAVRSVVEQGLHLFQSLGVGGMNTRGMGRLKVLGLENGEAGNDPAES